MLDTLTSFIRTATSPLVVILGPTGSGKTALSLELAKKLNGEIVNADSRQIYAGMDIGTNKITSSEMQDIPHHLLSFKKPNEIFTVAEYKELAVTAIRDILKRKKVPFLVGGTGLYINAVCFNYDIPKVQLDYVLRQNLEEELTKKGADFLHERLKKLDPEEAEKIHPHQTRYLIRALEIAMSGQKKSKMAKKKKPLFDCFFIGIDLPREELYRRIDQRVEEMFQKGLIEEVHSLLTQGYDAKAHAMNGIGYREVLAYLGQDPLQLPLGRGREPNSPQPSPGPPGLSPVGAGPTARRDGPLLKRGGIEEVKQQIKQNTRHFAKRQMTWFRRIQEIHWISPD